MSTLHLYDKQTQLLKSVANPTHGTGAIQPWKCGLVQIEQLATAIGRPPEDPKLNNLLAIFFPSEIRSSKDLPLSAHIEGMVICGKGMDIFGSDGEPNDNPPVNGRFNLGIFKTKLGNFKNGLGIVGNLTLIEGIGTLISKLIGTFILKSIGNLGSFIFNLGRGNPPNWKANLGNLIFIGGITIDFNLGSVIFGIGTLKTNLGMFGINPNNLLKSRGTLIFGRGIGFK